MNLKDVTKWNMRVSMVYALGVWTMLGSYGYYRFFLAGDEKDKPQDTATEDKEHLVDKRRIEEEKELTEGFHTKSTVQYREHFVPYSTRLLNFLKTLNGGAEK